MMAMDEAGNIPPPKLPERLKIGRYRNTPYLLGFQDVNQIKAKFQGESAGKSVLAGMKNQIFLPGIDLDTGAYASSLLGPTTVLSRTEVDAPGTQNDAERVTESRRDLRQATELRRLVNYRQGVAVIDTADPILFRFLPRADGGDRARPVRRLLDPPPSLAQAVQAMKELKASEAAQLPTNQPTDQESMMVNDDASEAATTLAPEQSQSTEAPATDEQPRTPEWLRRDQIEEEIDNDLLPFAED